MLCQIQLFFHYYFKIRYLLAKVPSHCGCLLYYRSVWQLAIRHVTWRILCANYKKHPSITKHFAQGDSEASWGCRLGRGFVLLEVHPLFFNAFAWFDLTRPCPRGVWQADNRRRAKRSWVLLPHPRQRASGSTALGQLCGAVMLEMLV